MTTSNAPVLTRRGKVVAGIALALALGAIYYIATHIWWAGDGWCFGTVIECHLGEATR